MTYLIGWFGFDEVEVNWDNQVDATRLGLNDECDELFKTESQIPDPSEICPLDTCIGCTICSALCCPYVDM
ncbi:hypothetical protein Q9233_001970 [Columba guinea]|nr:hypothetical protein Q9233_001970 [Columba guinea]